MISSPRCSHGINMGYSRSLLYALKNYYRHAYVPFFVIFILEAINLHWIWIQFEYNLGPDSI